MIFEMAECLMSFRELVGHAHEPKLFSRSMTESNSFRPRAAGQIVKIEWVLATSDNHRSPPTKLVRLKEENSYIPKKKNSARIEWVLIRPTNQSQMTTNQLHWPSHTFIVLCTYQKFIHSNGPSRAYTNSHMITTTMSRRASSGPAKERETQLPKRNYTPTVMPPSATRWDRRPQQTWTNTKGEQRRKTKNEEKTDEKSSGKNQNMQTFFYEMSYHRLWAEQESAHLHSYCFSPFSGRFSFDFVFLFLLLVSFRSVSVFRFSFCLASPFCIDVSIWIRYVYLWFRKLIIEHIERECPTHSGTHIGTWTVRRCCALRNKLIVCDNVRY